MITYFILGYIALGVLTVIINAYDPFSRSFDFTLCNGWVFFIFQVPILWVVMIIGWPYFLVRDLHEKISDIPNVRQWRQTGTFTKKL